MKKKRKEDDFLRTMEKGVSLTAVETFCNCGTLHEYCNIYHIISNCKKQIQATYNCVLSR